MRIFFILLLIGCTDSRVEQCIALCKAQGEYVSTYRVKGNVGKCVCSNTQGDCK